MYSSNLSLVRSSVSDSNSFHSLDSMMGSGKTTVGRVLSKSLGYYFFDRSRTWLFLSYVIAFVSLAGSAGMLVQDALLPDTPSSWTGIAGVLQCTFVLTSGLMYWTSRSATEY
ncbi:unnamed protein product [Sphagnum troendelagicum]|uniref:Uncharacterized protein n=1 Tax=Sphagnum troendelagicum TaxID=128251 RepID=A0ABP0UHS4_9BRYO